MSRRAIRGRRLPPSDPLAGIAYLVAKEVFNLEHKEVFNSEHITQRAVSQMQAKDDKKVALRQAVANPSQERPALTGLQTAAESYEDGKAVSNDPRSQI